MGGVGALPVGVIPFPFGCDIGGKIFEKTKQ